MSIPIVQQAVVIGAGPAGLMAAERLLAAGLGVDIYEAKPTPGRKFLRAGVGGLNLSNAEAMARFCERYDKPEVVAEWLQRFSPEQLREWASGLGVDTFIGSSGKIFPVGKKAAPLLRAWLHRLRAQGARIHIRHRWVGMDAPSGKGGAWVHQFDTAAGIIKVEAGVTVLACGGGSWAKLGSDGSWLPILGDAGVKCLPLQASNCGFESEWGEYFSNKFAGTPVKTVSLSLPEAPGLTGFTGRGEVMITRYGIEGGLVYLASRALRERLDKDGRATVCWDLLPDRSHAQVREQLLQPRGKQSLSNFLRKRLGIEGVKYALLFELCQDGKNLSALSVDELAGTLKALPQTLTAARPLDEAISTVGGVSMEAVDAQLMLRGLPGLYCAGEMMDWDAPTGGYLLPACFASGFVAGEAAAAYLQSSGS